MPPRWAAGSEKDTDVADAIEDREADAKSGNYNPLNISPAADDALRAAVRLELADAAAAAEACGLFVCPGDRRDNQKYPLRGAAATY